MIGPLAGRVTTRGGSGEGAATRREVGAGGALREGLADARAAETLGVGRFRRPDGAAVLHGWGSSAENCPVRLAEAAGAGTATGVQAAAVPRAHRVAATPTTERSGTQRFIRLP
jgi:hypothetical protein